MCHHDLHPQCPTLLPLNRYLWSQQLHASLSKALYPITNPLSHQSLDASWIYTSNLQVKGSGLSPQSLDLSLSPGSCAKMTLSLESVLPGLQL